MLGGLCKLPDDLLIRVREHGQQFRFGCRQTFAERLATYTPDFELYLQFDSLRASVLQRLRGEDLTLVRMQALEHLNELNLSTTLVVTVEKGVNDDEIGAIIDFALQQRCVRGAAESEVRKMAVQGGMHPIGEDGLGKVLRGVTTLSEVSRVVYLPEQGVKVCGSCSTVVAEEFEFCHHCGHFVGEHCGGCKRRVEAHWGFCPTCGTAARTSAAEGVKLVAKRRPGGRDTPSDLFRRAS